MLSKNQIKIINSLRLKKFRQKYDLFVVEGAKIIETILQSDNYEITQLYHTTDQSMLIDSRPEITQVSIDERSMKSISFLNSPSSALALVKTLVKPAAKWNKAIYLDGIQDPGNVGTIIRIADWYGMDTVIRSSASADFYSPKVIQSTMGAFANINLLDMDPIDLLAKENGQIWTADMQGENLNDIIPSDNFTLVMGSEGQGLSKIFSNDKVKKVTIPGGSNRISESLNVAVATGIICQGLNK